MILYLKKRQKDEKKRLNGKHLKTAVTVPKSFVVGCYPKSCLCIAGEVCGRSACVLRERSVVFKFNESEIQHFVSAKHTMVGEMFKIYLH